MSATDITESGKHMHVFVTGASGFIGRAVVAELVAAGHQVVGLARSASSASVVTALGATAHPGDLDDLRSLREGAEKADAVIHLANKHDWADLAESNRAERASVHTISEALAGSDRPFLLASGLAGFDLKRPVTERDSSPAVGPDSLRGGSENLALEYAANGVRVVGVRFAPTVHGEGDHGFVSIIAQAGREAGVVSYPEGDNRWPAVHRSDAARLVRLGLENAPAGAILHAVTEEGVPVRQIAEALGARLGLPARPASVDDIVDRLGFVGRVLTADVQASSRITRDLLDWRPDGPTLLDDIAAGHYDT